MRLRVLSLGAGVQSTTLFLLALDGTLPRLDAAIFADTGWEPASVYRHLDRLNELAAQYEVPLFRVSRGNLRADMLDPDSRYASVPYFVRNPDGSDGMGRRQCTAEYKIAPINRKVRQLLDAKPPLYRRVPTGRTVEQWIGFSTDEVGRVSGQKRAVSYVEKRYPLLEIGWSRSDCERYLRVNGWGDSVAKSACIGCPYHGNRQWRELRDTCSCGHNIRRHRDGGGYCTADRPTSLAANLESQSEACGCPRFDAPEWRDAVEFDHAIRRGGSRGESLNGQAYLHRSRVPLELAPINKVTRRELADRQVDALDLIADIEAEEGEPDGCSPYGCRSGSRVPDTEAS